MEAIALSPAGEEIARRRLTTPRDYVASLDAIAALVRELERAADAAGTVGVGIPGAVASRTGLVKNANSTWLNGRPLGRDREQQLGRPRRAYGSDPVRPRDRGRRGARRPGRGSDAGTIPRSAGPRARIADQRARPRCRGARGWHVKHRRTAGSDVRSAPPLPVCGWSELRSGGYPRSGRRPR